MYSTLYKGAPGHDQKLLVELRSLKKFEDQEAWFLKYVVSSNRSSTPQHPAFYMGPATVRSAWTASLGAEMKAHLATFRKFPPKHIGLGLP